MLPLRIVPLICLKKSVIFHRLLQEDDDSDEGLSVDSDAHDNSDAHEEDSDALEEDDSDEEQTEEDTTRQLVTSHLLWF